jgi:beta-glucanase (GH16 family)
MNRKRRFLVEVVAGIAALGLLTAGCSSQDSGKHPVDAQVQGGAASADGVLLDEEFDGNTLNTSLWNTCHWWQEEGCTIASNNELEWYLPGQVEVSGGALHLTAKRTKVSASDGKDYPFTSGMVTTGPSGHDMPPKLAFTYGKVDVRFRLPAGRGLWPAIWLLPASENSRPEIDMLEVTGDVPGLLRMHLHPKNRAAPSIGKDFRLPGGETLAGDWHTISLDWTPDKLIFALDGKHVWQLVDKKVPDEPMYLVMNLAVGGEYPGDPDKNTKFPATLSIDHVRIQRND